MPADAPHRHRPRSGNVNVDVRGCGSPPTLACYAASAKRFGGRAARFTRGAGFNVCARLRVFSAIAARSCLNWSECWRRWRCNSSMTGSCHISTSCKFSGCTNHRRLISGISATPVDDFTGARIGNMRTVPSQQEFHAIDRRNCDMQGIIFRLFLAARQPAAASPQALLHLWQRRSIPDSCP